MRRVTSLIFSALAGLATTPLHATTIVTDTVTFTYTTSAGTEQNNFSFVDGTIAPTDVHGDFSLPVSVYPNADQTGTATSGTFFNGETGYVGLMLNGGPTGAGATIFGNNYGGYFAPGTTAIYTGTTQTAEAMYLKPGTYQLLSPKLQLGNNPGYFYLDSASFTITQTTTSTPDPSPFDPKPIVIGPDPLGPSPTPTPSVPAASAVTPEPSSLALLGTGLLGIGGLLRRRVREVL